MTDEAHFKSDGGHALLPPETLDALMPFHIRLDGEGRIIGAGRTLTKLCQGAPLIGARFFRRFRVRKPRGLTGMTELREKLGRKLFVESASDRSLSFRGMAVAEGDPGQLLLNFSLAGDIAEITLRFKLKAHDFAAADSSVDLLYLIETQAVVLADLRDLTQRLHEAKAEAEHQALTDSLTGLPNRRALTTALARRLALRDSSGQRPTFALMQIDLDGFKAVNDTISHAAGDEVLKHAASILRSEIHHANMLARTGGDEFVAVIDRCPERHEVEQMCHRIIDRLSIPIPFEDRYCKIGASIGVAYCDDVPEYDADRLLVNADLALYESKRAGRGRVRFFVGAMREQHDAVNQLAAEIDNAIEADAFEPYFQPQINAITGRLEGFEALARWRHPTRGILSPQYFLYVASQANLLPRIDDIIVAKAFRTAARWRAKGHDVPKISINVTAARLGDPNFIETLIDAAFYADLAPECIGIEILESVLLDDDSEQIIQNIKRLDVMGFRLELDDFGTGHASISNLRKVPVSLVKIDRSLISGVDHDTELSKIAGAIIQLAHNLDVTPLAEGVETAGEIRTLVDLGCAHFQGYCIARPMPEDQVEGWIGQMHKSSIRPYYAVPDAPSRTTLSH
ncbi:MAG: putative bifunctional diguanylate cyclase/phosphodiesterase [Rhodomicrobiaceae bacterium]